MELGVSPFGEVTPDPATGAVGAGVGDAGRVA